MTPKKPPSAKVLQFPRRPLHSPPAGVVAIAALNMTLRTATTLLAAAGLLRLLGL